MTDLDNSEIIKENERIIDVDINKEMKKSFIEYSMSVIVSRALPDVRDGLKSGNNNNDYNICCS